MHSCCLYVHLYNKTFISFQSDDHVIIVWYHIGYYLLGKLVAHLKLLFIYVKETEEDKPIDQMPAEEVADEEIEAEDNENGEEADEEVNNEAGDSETLENAGEEGNNNEAEEVQEDEIEENDEAKEEDDEKVGLCNILSKYRV